MAASTGANFQRKFFVHLARALGIGYIQGNAAISVHNEYAGDALLRMAHIQCRAPRG